MEEIRAQKYCFENYNPTFHISHPKRFLHIGDKLEADFHSPRTLGIQAYHYSTTPEELRKVYEHEKICITAPSILSSLRSLGVRSTGNPDSVENQLGAGILGPVFTEFCEWVLDLCEEENINQVFPLMHVKQNSFTPCSKMLQRKDHWK